MENAIRYTPNKGRITIRGAYTLMVENGTKRGEAQISMSNDGGRRLHQCDQDLPLGSSEWNGFAAASRQHGTRFVAQFTDRKREIKQPLATPMQYTQASLEGDSGTTAGALDQIQDWQSTDKIDYAVAATPVNYFEAGTAADYTAALGAANTHFTNFAATEFYVVQIGADVVVFADNGTGAAVDSIVLVGRSLTDISDTNII